MNRVTLALAAVTAAFASLPAAAHHSFSMFDHNKVVSITGTVKELEWANPHAWLHIVAKDQKTGAPVDWAFEMASVSQISRQGWKSDSVKPGDTVTVRMHPLKDGTHGGQYVSATLGNGTVFKAYEPDAGIARSNTIQQ
jgi:Family of unknown function (DUF6152)